MNQIQALKDALTAAGMNASIWQDRRIYINGYGRDIKAYIAPEDPDSEVEPENLFAGCALKVFSNCNQSKTWLINRSKQVKFQIMQQLAEALGLPVCEKWEDVIL